MFQFPNQAQGTAPQSTGAAQGKQKETKTGLAYVNFYLPLADGTRVKLFNDLTLRLFLERAAEKLLVEAIKAGKITEAQAASMIQCEITLARDENTPVELDLSAFGVQP